METVLKIRRMHQVDGLSISAIANVTGLSRNSVRKYLRQASSEPPKYRRQQPAKPKLGEFEQTLTQWQDLDANRPKRHPVRSPADRRRYQHRDRQCPMTFVDVRQKIRVASPGLPASSPFPA